MSEHEAEEMAESFPPGSEHESQSAQGNDMGADPDAAMQPAEGEENPSGSSASQFPGGDSEDKLRGEVPAHEGDETSRKLSD